MINLLITTINVKLRTLFNLTIYNANKSVFKNKFKKISYKNNTEAAGYSLFINFSKKFLIYFVVMYAFVFYPLMLMNMINAQCLITLSLFTSFGIFLIKSPLISCALDKIYLVEHIKMNKKNVYLSDYCIKILLNFFLILSSLYCFKFIYDINSFSNEVIFLVSYITISMMLIMHYYNMRNNKINLVKVILSILFIVIGYALCYLKLSFSSNHLIILGIVLTIFNLVVAFKIFKYDKYDKLYKYEKEKFNRKNVKLKSYEQNLYKNEMNTVKVKKIDNPYKNYMNIFDKRYGNSLPKNFSFSFIFMALLFLILGFLTLQSESMKEIVNTNIAYGMPFFAFILLLINNSKAYVKNFYTKSDLFMNAHMFYRTQKVRVNMFKQRFIYLCKKNSSNCILFSSGLCILYYISGGTENVLEYVYLIVSIIFITMSINLYYLLVYFNFNPYKNNLEKINMKNIALFYFPHYIFLNILAVVLAIEKFMIYSSALLCLLLIVSLVSVLFNKNTSNL